MFDVTCNDDLGFLVPFVVDRWIKGDLTVEMKMTLHLPTSSKVINNCPTTFPHHCSLALTSETNT